MKRKRTQTITPDIFLDSGAFSAFTKGVEIDIHEYIRFLKEWRSRITCYANLDVIGDAEGTLENQRIMESEGLSPIPCFHQGEDYSFLKDYVAGYEYIALGGLAGNRFSRTEVLRHLDECFDVICCSASGLPQVKVHGFGLTSLPAMVRYPWYSVDSTSWVITSRMGSIYVPIRAQNKWCYDENSWKVAVSARSPAKKDAGDHYDNLTPMQKGIVDRYLKDKGYPMGKSVFDDEGAEEIVESGICNSYPLRDEINIQYFLDLEKHLPEWPWKWRSRRTRGMGL